MTWKNFCLRKNVPKIYESCCIQNMDIPNNFDGVNFKKAALDFSKRPGSLLLQGDPGRGKTYFMFALIHSLFEITGYRDHEVRLMNADDLDREAEDQMTRFRSCTDFLRSLSEVEILFIDDFGVETSKEKGERNYYSLLDKRLSNQRPTVISTNLTDEEVLRIFGSRIDSRLKQCLKLVFDGPDLREKKRL